jgi:O-antigen/teichoic acid export membrane protein
MGLPIGILLSHGGLLMPGPINYSTALALPTIAICQSAIILLTSEVNARQNTNKLAKLAPLSALAQAIGTLPLLILGGAQFIPLALATGSASALACTWLMANPLRPKNNPTIGNTAEIHRLLQFGGPWMLAAIGGAGVQSILVIIIVHNLGQQSAGLFRAGTTIAIQYMAILMGALSQVYAPKIASLRSHPEKLDRLNHRQSFITVNLIGIASLLLTICIDPVISLLFSSDFIASKALAVWYLVGMPLRSVSWCNGYVALATAPGWVLLIEELLVGTIWLLTATILMQNNHGIAGAGIGFATAYAAHLVLISYIACRWSRITPPWTAIGLSIVWSLLVFFAGYSLKIICSS